MKTMNKTLKKVLIIVLSVLVACAAVWGILTLVKNARRGDVNVYAATDFAMTDYWGDSTSTSGSVSTDRLQKVYVSSTQTVTEVYVTEGQTVRKGDKLLSYDTTLSALDLQRAQIALEREKQAYDNAKKENDFWQKDGKCRETLEKEAKQLEEEILKLKKKLAEEQDISLPDPKAPVLPHGDGTLASPLCQEIDSRPFAFTESWMREKVLLSSQTDLTAPVYVLLVEKEETDDMAYFIPYQGVKLIGTWTDEEIPQLQSISMTLEDALSLPEAEDPLKTLTSTQIEKKLRELSKIRLYLENTVNLPDTPADLEKLKAELKNQLSAKDVSLKLAQLNLNKIKAEVQDGAVYSDLDGVIKVVRDATEAYNEGSAVVEVSGGGGYYVTGSIGEMDLQSVTVGQIVTINSWMTGANCEGEIIEISEYPTTFNTGWSNGNNNISWYPMKIFVSDDANLQEGDWVDISYQANAENQGNTWYLETMFIRTENGKSYVMVRGEDGRLEQRFIQTGRDLWGSYTEVRGGLTVDDYVAFPYGKDVTVGAKTVESTPDQFYNYY